MKTIRFSCKFIAAFTAFVTVLVVLALVVLSACSSSAHSYTYPEEYSAEYCFDQYELFDPNIAYTECYEFVSKKNWGGDPAVNFSAIKDCENLYFMVYYKTA